MCAQIPSASRVVVSDFVLSTVVATANARTQSRPLKDLRAAKATNDAWDKVLVRKSWASGAAFNVQLAYFLRLYRGVIAASIFARPIKALILTRIFTRQAPFSGVNMQFFCFAIDKVGTVLEYGA